MKTEDQTWVQLAEIDLNARLRNQIELFMLAGKAELAAPAKAKAGACTCPAGALSEDATAESK